MESEIEEIVIESCTVGYDEFGVINPSLSRHIAEVKLVMSPEQILYRDQLNRENTASRMRQRMLNQLAERNGSS